MAALPVNQSLALHYQEVDQVNDEVSKKVVQYVAVAAVFVLIASLVHFTQFFDGHSLFLMRAVSVMTAGGFLIAALHQHLTKVEKMKQAALFTTLVAITSILAFAAFASALHFNFSSYVTMGLTVGATLSMAAASALVYYHRKDKEPPKAITADNFEEILRERNSEGLNLFQEAALNGDFATFSAFLAHNHGVLSMKLPDGNELLQTILQKNPKSKVAQTLLILEAYYDRLPIDQYAFMQAEFQLFFAFLRQDELSDDDVEAIKELNIQAKITEFLDQIDSFSILSKFAFKFDHFALFDSFCTIDEKSLIEAIENRRPGIAMGILKALKEPNLTVEQFQNFKALYESKAWLAHVLPVWHKKMDLPGTIDSTAESFDGTVELDQALGLHLPRKVCKLLELGFYPSDIDVLFKKRKLSNLWKKNWEKIDQPNAPFDLDQAIKYELTQRASYLLSQGQLTENFLRAVQNHPMTFAAVLMRFIEKPESPLKLNDALKFCCNQALIVPTEFLLNKGAYHDYLLVRASVSHEFLPLLKKCKDQERLMQAARSSTFANVKAFLGIQ